MRHYLLACALLLVAATLAFAALPATDAFTGTNGTALQTYSTNWTINAGGFQINTNSVACSQNNEGGAHWNADSFNNDQYAQATVSAIGSGFFIGLGVRESASGATYYGIYYDNGVGQLFKNVAGTWTQLGSNSVGVSSSDVLRLEAAGTTITPKKNGATTGTPGAQTDSSISSGFAGLSCWGNSTGSRVDDWQGGNLGGGGPSGPPPATLSAPVIY